MGTREPGRRQRGERDGDDEEDGDDVVCGKGGKVEKFQRGKRRRRDEGGFVFVKGSLGRKSMVKEKHEVGW